MKENKKKATLDRGRKLSKEELRRKEKLDLLTEQLTPYCTCASPLKRNEYIIGGAMPTIILWFGLFLVSLITGSIPLYFLALFNTLSGCGDMLILLMLCRYKSECQDILVYDHPYEGGSVIFER